MIYEVLEDIIYMAYVSKRYYASKGLKVLRSGIVVKPPSVKQLHGLHTLERAYIECKKVCIAKQPGSK